MIIIIIMIIIKMPITQSFVVLTLPRMKLALGCFIDVVIFRVICVETKDENLKTALIMDYIATLTDKSSIREKDFVFNNTSNCDHLHW